MSKERKKTTYFIHVIKISFFVFLSIVVIKLFIFNENSQSSITYNFHNSNNIRRSVIIDRSGEVIVSNNASYSLYISPSHTSENSSWIKSIAAIVYVDEKELINKVSNARIITMIADDLTLQQVEMIKKLEIKGAEIIRKEKRAYPHNKLALNILGFLDKDNRAIDGLEYFYENSLRNQIFENYEINPSFHITMEKNLQKNAETELGKLLSNVRGTGSAIFMGIDTGEILAMANYPLIDHDLFIKDNKKINNNSITQNFRPIPVILLSNWITYKKNNPSFELTSANVKENIPSNINENIKIFSHFDENMLKAITDEGNFHSLFVSLGFGQNTEIDLPDETGGLIKDAVNSGQRNLLDVYGTPLQILRAYSALINDGKLVKPFFSFNAFNKDSIKEVEAERLELKKYSAFLRKILSLSNGKPIVTYDINPNLSGEENRQMIIIGHYPVNNPVISYIISANGMDFNQQEINNYVKRFLEMAQNASKIKLLTMQENTQNKNELFTQKEDITVLKNMPDMSGMSMRKALKTLHGSCGMSFEGSGIVISQYPSPGTTINHKTLCQLKFK